jgi:hypothetical protein
MMQHARPRRFWTCFRPFRGAASSRRWLPFLLLFALAGGCASREMVLELQGSVLYDKPSILSVTHSIEDRRGDGGTVVVTVRVKADPGLDASFDISPGIVERHALSESSAGAYEGAFALPRDLVGGPFTIIARARHAEAGEVTAKDPVPLTIALPR